MSSDLPPLKMQSRARINGEPCLLEVTERLFGSEIAELVWSGLAGQRHYVATRPSEDNPLSRLIGRDKATLVGSEIGGVFVVVPTAIGIRHRRVIRLFKAGLKVREIVAKTGYSERHVQRLANEARSLGYLPAARLKGGRR